MPKYMVGIVHTALSHFAVEADDEDAAKEKARAAFGDGCEEIMLGNEYDRIDDFFVEKLPDEETT